jgi:hypothetical protein
MLLPPTNISLHPSICSVDIGFTVAIQSTLYCSYAIVNSTFGRLFPKFWEIKRYIVCCIEYSLLRKPQCMLIESLWLEANPWRFYIVCFYMCCHWRFSYQERRVETPSTGLTPPYCCVCPKPGPGFPTSLSLLCSVSSAQIRGDCSFCWYWWNWWTSLFKLSFHNIALSKKSINRTNVLPKDVSRLVQSSFINKPTIKPLLWLFYDYNLMKKNYNLFQLILCTVSF